MIVTNVFFGTGPQRGARVPFAGLLRLARQRRELAKLDARQLSDIGLTAAAAKSEANRPFWDVPSHWRG